MVFVVFEIANSKSRTTQKVQTSFVAVPKPIQQNGLSVTWRAIACCCSDS